LSDQRHLAHASLGESLDFVHDLFDRSRNFGPARIRHHAERAELVTAFLHGDESGNAAPGDGALLGRSKDLELVLDGEFGVDNSLAEPRPCDHLRQAMIVLRADHQVDSAGAANNLLALGLRHAAGNRDYHLAAIARGRLFQFADTTNLGIDLLGSFFADVAGVQDDEIGIFRRRGLGEAFGCQGIRHTMRIVDVHLAAK